MARPKAQPLYNTIASCPSTSKGWVGNSVRDQAGDTGGQSAEDSDQHSAGKTATTRSEGCSTVSSPNTGKTTSSLTVSSDSSITRRAKPSQAVILATIPYTVYQPERTSQPISHRKEPSVNVVSTVLQQQTNQSREQQQTANVVSTAQQQSHHARWHQTAKTVTARLQGGIGVDRGPARGAALVVRLGLAVEGQVIVTERR